VLEDRTLLDVKLSGSTLLITGTTGNDTALVQQIAATGKQPALISVTLNGRTFNNFKVTQVSQIQAQLDGGNDTFTLDHSSAPVTPPVVVDGGTGTNALVVNGTAGADVFAITGSTLGLAGTGGLQYSNFQSLTVNGLGGGDSATVQVAGDFNGGVNLNSSSTLPQVSVSGTVSAASVLQAGNVANVTVGTLAGQLIASAGSVVGASITTVTATGLLKATEVTALPGSGVLSGVTITTLSGTLLAGSISGLNVTTVNQGAVIKAAGQGTTTNVSIGSLSGSFTAPEDSNAGSGVMSNTSIGSVSSTGVVSTGSISGMSVGSNAGSITAAGQGTTTNVSIGSLSGSFTAPEDSNAGSGVMSNTTIDSISSTGVVSTGSISGMSVGSNAGSITAAGQGTTTNVSIGSLSGSFTAPEDSNAGSGVMSNTSIGSVSSTGVVSTGSISGMSVGSNAGSITAAGQGTTTNVSIGSLSGSFTAPEDSNAGSGVMSNTTIDSVTSTGTVSTGSISGMSVGSNAGSITAAGQGVASDVAIGTLSGTLAAQADSTPGSGALNNVLIGTLTTTGSVIAATVSSLTITTAAGTVNVSNTLTSLAVGTALPTANFKAGHFSVVTVVHVSPVVTLVEPAAARTVGVTPHTGTAVPDLGLYYDGTGAGDPRVVVQINAATPVGFDLGVTTNVATNNGQGIDVAGLYSVGNAATGIFNAVVGGDLLLGAVPAGAVSFFAGLGRSLPNSTGGVQLPQDNVAVAIAGNAPAASIVAKAVPALAAGSFGAVSADAAANTDALVPLAAGTGLIQANDSYQVFVTEANHVAQFLVTGPGGSFDNKKMLFADQVSDNRPVTATDFLVPTGSSTSVNEVDFTGQGGSLTTSQPVLATIKGAPGASLGDLILGAPQGITANITADSIIGNIDATNGGISGVIQTTVGDLGRALIDPTTGKITGVTFIHTGGGGLTTTGKIISKANLVSQLNLKSGLDGVVAAGGDIGVIQLTNGLAPQAPAALTRFGGIVVSTGGLNGQVVALGNVFGDISVTGGLSGRIAVRGREEFGLSAGQNFSRTGILGNVSIGGGISPTGAIVAAGLIGDDGSGNIKKDTLGTHLTISGTDKGIIAAEEDINFGATGSLNTAGTFENVGTPGSPQYANGVNKAAIDNIFTDGGVALPIADVLLGPNSLILQDLLALTVGADGNLTGTHA
jgi:hypothetical protein